MAASRRPLSEILFLVYRCTLSRHSIVFRNIFDLGQNAVGFDQDFMDGVPVIQLSVDPWRLEAFLKALHNPLSV